MEVTIESLQAENEHLNSRLMKAAEIFKSYKEQIESLNNTINALTQEKQNLAAAVNEKDEKLFNIDEMIHKLSEERDAATTKLAEQTANNESILNENNKLKEELDKLKNDTIPNMMNDMKKNITTEIENVKATTKRMENVLVKNFDLFA